MRIWNIYRKDLINEYQCNQGTLQNLTIHSMIIDANKRQEYLIMGKSINERNLLLFEYTRPSEDSVDSTNLSAVC